MKTNTPRTPPMPTNKPEVALPELPLGDRLRRIHDDAVASGYTVDTSIDLATLKEAADALTRPADGEFVMVPREATREIISAMLESRASDEEGEFPALMDLIDFSGQNKNHAVVRAAYRAMLSAAPQQGGQEVERTCMNTCTHSDFFNGLACEKCLATVFSPTGVSAQQPAEAVAHERDALAEAIGNAAVKCGLLATHVTGLTGPQLLMLCDDMASAITTPPPAIDIGKLRELVERWRVEAAEARAIGQPLITFDKGHASATELRANELAALIGDGGEVGNG